MHNEAKEQRKPVNIAQDFVCFLESHVEQLADSNLKLLTRNDQSLWPEMDADGKLTGRVLFYLGRGDAHPDDARDWTPIRIGEV